MVGQLGQPSVPPCHLWRPGQQSPDWGGVRRRRYAGSQGSGHRSGTDVDVAEAIVGGISMVSRSRMPPPSAPGCHRRLRRRMSRITARVFGLPAKAPFRSTGAGDAPWSIQWAGNRVVREPVVVHFALFQAHTLDRPFRSIAGISSIRGRQPSWKRSSGRKSRL